MKIILTVMNLIGGWDLALCFVLAISILGSLYFYVKCLSTQNKTKPVKMIGNRLKKDIEIEYYRSALGNLFDFMGSVCFMFAVGVAVILFFYHI